MGFFLWLCVLISVRLLFTQTVSFYCDFYKIVLANCNLHSVSHFNYVICLIKSDAAIVQFIKFSHYLLVPNLSE